MIQYYTISVAMVTRILCRRVSFVFRIDLFTRWRTVFHAMPYYASLMSYHSYTPLKCSQSVCQSRGLVVVLVNRGL